jgi:copper transport protein
LSVLKTLIALACCLFVWSQAAFGHVVPDAPVSGAALAQASAAHAVIVWLARWLTYLCLFLVGGAALFCARRPDSEPGRARPLVLLGLILLLADLGLHGLGLLGAPWRALSGWAPWKAALSSPYALALALMALALLGGWAALSRPGRRSPWPWAAASALLPGIAVAVSVPTGAAAPWVARPLVALHVWVALAWVGALVPLYRMAHPQTASGRSGGQPPGRVHPLAWALGVAVPIVLSGLALAFLRLRHWTDLLHTDEGSVLLGTLVLAAVLLVVALRNRWRLAASGPRDSVQAQARLRRGLGTEIILAVGALSVAALWHVTPPTAGRVAVDEPHGPVIALENREVRALVALPAPGAAVWCIQVISIDGATLDPQRVTLTLGDPSAGVDPEEHAAQRQPDGRWRVDLPVPPEGGQWHVRVDVWVGDFNQITLQRDLALPRRPEPAPAAGVHPRQ